MQRMPKCLRMDAAKRAIRAAYPDCDRETVTMQAQMHVRHAIARMEGAIQRADRLAVVRDRSCGSGVDFYAAARTMRAWIARAARELAVRA